MGKVVDDRFEELSRTVIPFGNAHKGETFDEVPLSYLDWLAGRNDRGNTPFERTVKAAKEYLSYDVIQKQLREEMGD